VCSCIARLYLRLLAGICSINQVSQLPKAIVTGCWTCDAVAAITKYGMCTLFCPKLVVTIIIIGVKVIKGP
jgi:hypothetical protein